MRWEELLIDCQSRVSKQWRWERERERERYHQSSLLSFVCRITLYVNSVSFPLSVLGLTSPLASSLPLIMHVSLFVLQNSEDQTCAVCLEAFHNNDSIRVLPCKWVFCVPYMLLSRWEELDRVCCTCAALSACKHYCCNLGFRERRGWFPAHRLAESGFDHTNSVVVV